MFLVMSSKGKVARKQSQPSSSIWRKKRNAVLEKFGNNHQSFLVSQSDNYPTKSPKSQSNDLKYHNLFQNSHYKSSSTQLWPIVGLIKGYNPFLIGMYCGSIKPKCHLFLKDFSDELKMLTSSPFVVNDKSYMVQIYAFICDAPARSLLKEVNVDLRTNIEFLDYTYANRDHNGRCHQHEKYIFSEINSLDFINMFTLDYMHLVCLGATRRNLYFLKVGLKELIMEKFL
ncbi:uncharacterized protein LOC136090675 isoform X3 [Hydra vulgaris]|uniref:Uncharacterized protein LOC136090675 isoform X3 n=1 Tax=Hydra vulgaris TaxID=6087 RepID=A0ABM4DGK9_HYDVU